ncbi:TetR/AcrR family transcriptional regulator [Aeromicrobium choanae]|uniref:Transcriptional regulator, TetR family n=1 Tax=Aeromicrobium choanae TaxID=1736691 RepID=A0A1T4Z832_9ACTN|nr:TetR/AcrR family transcriptional regulator [Aeromicrobium choanae]SKB09771.1 transcriptional regulator, TetR family [Aeromicrobium choanae]
MSPPAAAHRPSLRDDILESTLELARTGAAISLESAARATGITKPGLMYHFPTKEALMTAVVDHLMDGYERDLQDRLGADPTAPSATERLIAYLDWVCEGRFDSGDLVMFADPRLRDTLTSRWNERISPWVAVPDSLPATRRARLHGVRLIADGMWFNAAGNGLPLSDSDRAAVRALAHQLIEGTS